MEVCTIIAKNYVAHARVLARSLAEHNPGSRLWTLIIDDFDGYIDPAHEPFEVLTPADVGCEPFEYMALRYTVLELSTAVKPWLLRHLMEQIGGPVTYLDPDIKVYGSLQPLDELAADHGVVVIPHNNVPLPPDGRMPSQVDVMIAGVYNLGYVSLAPRDEVDRLLDWWAERLRRDCRVDPVWGYFVDQRWFDLVPGFLADFAIVRDPEYNVAYWNLHSRKLDFGGGRYLVDGRPLAFFHFSGFDPARPLSLSRHQNRIDVTAEPVLEQLLAEYAHEVEAEGHSVSRNWPYSYVALGDGTEIDELVRSFCEEFEDELEERGEVPPSPFTLDGARAFRSWLGEDAPLAPPGINRVLARVYESRGDLQTAFPDLGGGDREGLLRWAAELGPAEVPLLGKVDISANGDARRHDALADDAAPIAYPGRRLKPLPDEPWGVNVIGHFHSQSELGEMARRLVATFDAAGIPAAPVQDWSTPVVEQGASYPALGPDEAPYVVNLICVDSEMVEKLASSAAGRLLAGRYSVLVASGNQAPDPGLGHLFQEVWTLSPDGAGSVERHFPNAQRMPLPLEPPPFRAASRRELGLPENRFVFMCGVDVGSRLAGAAATAIEAFGRTFEPDEPVALVISCIGPGGREDLHNLRRAAAQLPGVEVIEQATRAEALALRAHCDCWVSLDRSEPFGLSLAEAMWIGKPTVSTDEPDIDHASAAMRAVFNDPPAARARGARASAQLRSAYGSSAVGRAFRRRLESIRVTAQVPQPTALSAKAPPGLTYARRRVHDGPAPLPRGGGRGTRVRAKLRNALLRAMRPYTDYQRKVDLALIDALEEIHGSVPVERANLLSELRGARQLRDSLAIQAGALDELRRRIELQGDRALYLALNELSRRHASISAGPADVLDALPLEPFELRVYSQNGEDGVLAETLRRIGAPSRCFVEFGVESGSEGNCVYLADVAGWNGLFMEADDQLYKLLERKYGASQRVRTAHEMVTAENIDQLMDDANVPAEPDVISIDVDGQDYWIWEAITRRRPRVVVIEYNSALDPHRRLVQPKDSPPWDGTDFFGASLGAIRSLGESKGYRLVHTELAGSNAFLVAEELAEGRFPEPDEVPMRSLPNYFQSGYRHPPDELDRSYLDLDTGEMVSSKR